MLHQICVLYNPSVNGDNFVCNNCDMGESETMRTKFSARELAHNELSQHMETRLNRFLNKEKIVCPPIIIRNLFSVKKNTALLPYTLQWFRAKYHNDVNYQHRSKGIFAFQSHNGAEICIFAMYVQEYSHSPEPNNGRIYLSYMDSINFLEPKMHRTAIYQQIVLGYAEYMKSIGFNSFHLWPCPPKVGLDYIFYRHPTTQKYPSQARLNRWYTEIFKKGIDEGIFTNYCNDLTEPGYTFFRQIPYFEGDFFPDAIECCIRSNKSDLSETEMIRKLNSTIKKYKYNFFIGEMNAIKNNLIDPDPLKSCNVLNDRSELLLYAYKYSMEFSTLRLAKFSTLDLLRILHSEEMTFICKMCNRLSDFIYQCTDCKKRAR